MAEGGHAGTSVPVLNLRCERHHSRTGHPKLKITAEHQMEGPAARAFVGGSLYEQLRS
jgi:hypothetical protein